MQLPAQLRVGVNGRNKFWAINYTNEHRPISIKAGLFRSWTRFVIAKKTMPGFLGELLPGAMPARAGRNVIGDRLHPVVLPHISHFMHVPLRTSVKLPHSPQASPS